MININYRDSRPIFEQVKDGFIRLIISGALSAGEKIPSVRELAASLAINPNTIQRAYREMEAEGYICSVQGKGSFVSTDNAPALRHREALCSRLSVLLREMRQAGIAEEEIISIIGEEFRND